MNLQASLFVYESFCPYRATNLRHDYPGRCPGLGASALSGRVALTCEKSAIHFPKLFEGKFFQAGTQLLSLTLPD